MSAPGMTSAGPAGHRAVSVLTAGSMLDVTLPDGATCVELLPELLRMLPEGPEAEAVRSPDPDTTWWLFQVGGRPLPADVPVAAAVAYGEPLYLVPDAHRFVPPRVSVGGGLWDDGGVDRSTGRVDGPLVRLVLAAVTLLVLDAVLAWAVARHTAPTWACLAAAGGTAVASLAATLADRQRSRAGRDTRTGLVGSTVAVAGLPAWVVTAAAVTPWRAHALLPGIASAAVGVGIGVLVLAAAARTVRQRAVVLSATVAAVPAAVVAVGGAAIVAGAGMHTSASAFLAAAASALAVLATVAVAIGPTLAVRWAARLPARATASAASGDSTPDRAECVRLTLTAVLVGAGVDLAAAWTLLALSHGIVALLPVTVGVIVLQASGFAGADHRLVVTGVAAVGVADLLVFWLRDQPATTAVLTLLAAAVTLAVAAVRPGTRPGTGPGARGGAPLRRTLAETVERLLVIACVPLLAAALGLFDLVATLGGRWGG